MSKHNIEIQTEQLLIISIQRKITPKEEVNFK